MCGIAGIKRFGTEPISVEEIRLLMLGIEHRGNHASGLALINPDGTVHVHKKDTPAWKFLVEDDTEAFLEEFLNEETKTVLIHTRFATVGNPIVNENNHPMYMGKVAVVHNGGIGNHEMLFKADNMKRSCETDSDIIRAMLDQHGLTEAGVRNLNRMSGGAAIAAITPEDPDRLLLARSGNPIKYAITDDKLWWASELAPLTNAVRPFTLKHGLVARLPRPDVAYLTMPDHTAYIIGANGLESRHEFRISHNFTPRTYRTHDSYATKRRSWQEEEDRKKRAHREPVAPVRARGEETQKFGNCPKCQKALMIPADDNWADYVCLNKKCKINLEELDSKTN